VEVLHEAASGRKLAPAVTENTDVGGRTFPAHTSGRVNFPRRFPLGSKGASLVFSRREDVARYINKLDCKNPGCKQTAEAGKPCRACSEECTAHVESPDGTRMSLKEYFPSITFDSRDAAELLLVLGADPPLPGWFSPGAPGRAGDPGRPEGAHGYPSNANILFHLSKTAGAHHNTKSGAALKGYIWAIELVCCMPRRSVGVAGGLCGSRILFLCPVEGAGMLSFRFHLVFTCPTLGFSNDATGADLSGLLMIIAALSLMQGGISSGGQWRALTRAVTPLGFALRSRTTAPRSTARPASQRQVLPG
jgi:hypothetical protein